MILNGYGVKARKRKILSTARWIIHIIQVKNSISIVQKWNLLRNVWSKHCRGHGNVCRCVQRKSSALWEKVFSPVLFSELTTVVINIFQSTWKSIMRLLRTLWSSLIKSAQVLAAPAANMTAEQKVDAVLRIVSLAVGGALRTLICWRSQRETCQTGEAICPDCDSYAKHHDDQCITRL